MNIIDKNLSKASKVDWKGIINNEEESKIISSRNSITLFLVFEMEETLIPVTYQIKQRTRAF